MTAEVAILNHQAIALAADSAVTVGRERVWKHANKIFSAGPSNDIGIMIFNTGDFLGTPWETIVKEFRRTQGNIEFARVVDFSNAFIEYIKKIPSHKREADLSIQLIIIDICEDISEELRDDNRINFYADFEKVVEEEIEDIETNGKILDEGLSYASFKVDFRKIIKDLADDIFKFKPKREMLERLAFLIYLHVCRKSESEYSSGIVIAGYGRDEFFPCVYNYVIDGRWRTIDRLWETDRSVNFNEEDSAHSGIMPFAQSDMASLFVEGVYPRYKIFLETVISGLLNEKSKAIIHDYVPAAEKVVETARQAKDNKTIVDELLKDFSEYRQKSFVSPLLRTVSALPKEEMAFMAKAIVELTALRRKFTSNVESVGGAIDVAIISKGDGFVWIDRKHYFDININHDFRDRKSLSRGGNRDA